MISRRTKTVTVIYFENRYTKVDDFWEPAKKQLLADAKGFMDSLVKFDKDNIPDRIIKKVSSCAASTLYFAVVPRTGV